MSCLKDYFQRMFDYKGVSTRKDYWLMQLWLIPLYFVPLIIIIPFSFIAGSLQYSAGSIAYGIAVICTIIMFLGYIIIFYPMIPLIVRRLHDINKSGFFILFGFIPLLNIFLFVCMLLDTEISNNKWREYDIERGRWVKYL